MSRLAVAIAVLALAAGANAALLFPYATCSRPLRRSVYSVKSAVQKGAQVCFTFAYNRAQCTEQNICCTADFHKLELDIKPTCVTRQFKGVAYLNGKQTKTGPQVRHPPNGDAKTDATLYVSNLGLDQSTAEGAELCLEITGGPCTTLEQLTKTPGSWATAQWDSTHKCCPVTRPGSPPPPPPPATCVTTLIWTAPGAASWDFTKHCTSARAAVAEILTTFGSGILSYTTITCSKTSVTTTVTFKTIPDGAKFKSDVEDAGYEVAVWPVFDISGDECPPELAGGTPTLTGTVRSCSPVVVAAPECQDSSAPPPPKSPFPFCECNKTPGATPFYIDSPTASGTKYAFPITTAAPLDPSTNCGKSPSLSKVEFYFSYAQRRAFLDTVIEYANGQSEIRHPSWGKPEENTFKVSNLDWTAAQITALKPKIVITLKPGFDLEDIAMGGAYYASLFDEEKNCCPTFMV